MLQKYKSFMNLDNLKMGLGENFNSIIWKLFIQNQNRCWVKSNLDIVAATTALLAEQL